MHLNTVACYFNRKWSKVYFSTYGKVLIALYYLTTQYVKCCLLFQLSIMNEVHHHIRAWRKFHYYYNLCENTRVKIICVLHTGLISMLTPTTWKTVTEFVKYFMSPPHPSGLFSPAGFSASATNQLPVSQRETEVALHAVNCGSCYVGWWCNEGQCTPSAVCGPGALVDVDACHCVTGRVRRRGLLRSLCLCCRVSKITRHSLATFDVCAWWCTRCDVQIMYFICLSVVDTVIDYSTHQHDVIMWYNWTRR